MKKKKIEQLKKKKKMPMRTLKTAQIIHGEEGIKFDNDASFI